MQDRSPSPHEVDIERAVTASSNLKKEESITHEHEEDAYSSDRYEEGSLKSRLAWLASKLHVEARGIERVPEDARTDTSYWNISSMVRPFSASLTTIQSMLPALCAKAEAYMLTQMPAVARC